ncbi:CapA family protein [Paenibacillus turpanensis]|uniref:CapA family protein n=1 Tax=Paenibacillus turpanensis TaxID=2689078 RepID=UPI0014072FB7|nr:CapA family protein [Paenibacillus turpanensis]
MKNVLRNTARLGGVFLFVSALLLLSGCQGESQSPDMTLTNEKPSLELQEQSQVERSAAGSKESSESGGLVNTAQDAPSSDPALLADRSGPPVMRTARLMAVGDIMMHSPQIPSGYDASTGTYNYDGFFAHVQPLFAEADWVIGNLETPLAGEDNGGYSGYPRFNAPDELADALKKAGFSMLTTANNHAMDRNAAGAIHTLEVLRERGIIASGTAASPEEAEVIPMLERNGIKLALLAYTYGTNGIPVPKDKPYLVNHIDDKKIVSDIIRARASGADVVAVALHLGNEYQLVPTPQQREIAEQCIQAGAHIVLGSHPHVVQPDEFIETEGLDGKPKRGYVIYSLGNFISNQRGKYTDYGVIVNLQIVKNMSDGTVQVSEAATLPTWVHQFYSEDGKRHYRVLPLEQIIADKSDPLLPASLYPQLEKGLEDIRKHLE